MLIENCYLPGMQARNYYIQIILFDLVYFDIFKNEMKKNKEEIN